jgi:hypothetical protein
MNIIRTTIALLFCNIALSQVSLQTNLPPTVAPNTTLNLEVKISKGSISSFSKYQIDVPTGMTISENVSKTGNFTFDAPRAKIVWVNIPAEPEFVVKFVMNTGSVTGPGVFNQKLYYVDESGKREFEAEPVNVNIDPSGATTTTSFPEISSVASNTTSVNSGSSGNTGNPETGPGSSSAASNTVASSGSSGNNGSSGGNMSGTSSPTLPLSTGSGNNGSGSVAETKTKENTSGSGGSASSSGSSGNTAAKTVKENPSGSGNSSGLVYKVQLGAYGADPGKSKFSAAGKVTISKEDGFYKVITGNFNTKEEAIQANEALKSKGFSGFVVKYQNGVRVK